MPVTYHQLKGKDSNECSKCYGDRDGPSVLNFMVIFSEEIDAVGDSSYDGQVKSKRTFQGIYILICANSATDP